MTTATLRDFRANLKSYFDALNDNKDVMIIPRQGDKEAIVLMTLSEYNSMVETEYLLSNKANKKVLEKAMEELDTGDIVEFSSTDK